jgi:tetratricopeptide (TPR) repeat protein
MAALGLPLALLVFVELILRLAGVGFPAGFFLRRPINGRECWMENPLFGRRFFPASLTRRPGHIAIPVQKSTHAIRIFVLGESAALGDPIPAFGFSRMLQRLLEARFPGRQFEVVNVAMTAINSHAILPIARDCAERDGDIWIIYMGNNEVVGPFGPGTVLGPTAVSLGMIRATLALKRTRTGQLLDTATARLRGHSGQPSYWKGMELMAQGRVRRDDPRLALVYANFKRNLEDVLRAGASAGVPILLCTVGVNQEHCPPFASVHRPDLVRADRAGWDQSYTAGVALENAGRFSDALTEFQKAARYDATFAEAHFRLGHCLLALDRDVEARMHFQRAVDEDTLRFRADSEINRIIRDAASAWGGKGIGLLDVEQVLARDAPHGIAGQDSFYEHVHLTPHGNYLLARAAAEQVARLPVLVRARSSETSMPASSGAAGKATTGGALWISPTECEAQLGYTEWNQSQALRVVLDRMQFAPFLGTINHSNRLQQLQRQIGTLKAVNTPGGYRAQAERVRQAVARHPDDWQLRENLGLLLSLSEDLPRAVEQLRSAIKLMPQAPGPYFSLGGVLALQGQADEAIQNYRECLRLEPDNFHAWMRLGIVELDRRRYDVAIRYLRAAILAKPDSVSARLYLGAALLRQNQRREAQEQLEEVLRLEPDNAEARRLLQRP